MVRCHNCFEVGHGAYECDQGWKCRRHAYVYAHVSRQFRCSLMDYIACSLYTSAPISRDDAVLKALLYEIHNTCGQLRSFLRKLLCHMQMHTPARFYGILGRVGCISHSFACARVNASMRGCRCLQSGHLVVDCPGLKKCYRCPTFGAQCPSHYTEYTEPERPEPKGVWIVVRGV